MNTPAAENHSLEHKPVFCTIMRIGNVHLTKDIGLIPYGMYKYQGYDAFIASDTGNRKFPNLKYVPGLRIESVPMPAGNWLIDSCLWLIKNAKRIDVLNIYHMTLYSVLQAVFFRVFSRKGKIYLKCDGCPTKTSGRAAKSRVNRFFKSILGGWLIRNIDAVSTEFPENAAVLKSEWGVDALCVPNPINPNEIHDFRPFSERSNVIAYGGDVQREKGVHTLLEAFAKIADKIPDWTLKIAGVIREQDIIDDFRAKYKELEERVNFLGMVSNRNEYVELCRDAKIFAFPTRHESFGISQIEAMTYGCFLVCTRIPASERLTQNFKYALGSEVDDVDGMAENLLYACTHESEIESLAVQGRAATLERCSLEAASRTIAKALR